ncbi:Protein of unknown function [Gryllus bimaculatus]|nr:Protein of unknown function [Gryllus bimaculatus]
MPQFHGKQDPTRTSVPVLCGDRSELDGTGPRRRGEGPGAGRKNVVQPRRAAAVQLPSGLFGLRQLQSTKNVYSLLLTCIATPAAAAGAAPTPEVLEEEEEEEEVDDADAVDDANGGQSVRWWMAMALRVETPVVDGNGSGGGDGAYDGGGQRTRRRTSNLASVRPRALCFGGRINEGGCAGARSREPVSGGVTGGRLCLQRGCKGSSIT